MKNVIFIICFLVFNQNIFGQKNNAIDSLTRLVSISKHDSTKLNIYLKICELCDIKDNLKYGTLALKFVEGLENKTSIVTKIRLLKYKAEFTNILYVYYQDKYNINKQLEVKQQLISIYRDINDTNLLEETYSDIIDILFEQRKTNAAFELANNRLNKYEKNNSLNYVAFYQSKLGSLYDKINYFDKMVEYYQRNLTTNIKMNDIKGVAFAHSLLARAYYYNHNPQRALEHSLKSLEYFQKENNNRKIFSALLETSSIYTSLKKFNKAIELSNQSHQIAIDFKDSSMVSNVLFGRITIYSEMKDYLNAAEYGKRWYNISTIENNEFNAMNAGITISRNYLNLNQIENALKYIRISDSIAKKKNDIYAMRNLYEIKFMLYRKKGNFEIALENRLHFDQLNDSIIILENHNGLEKKDIILEFEKDQLKLKDEQLIKDQRAESAKSKQKAITLSISLGLVIVFVLMILIFRNYKLKQRSNLELSKRNEEILIQKKLVEEKQKEIIESITYAKRLQEAILPPQEFIDKHVPNNFILYKPKDLVAGDFYWAEKINDMFFIAAADSTGHGVPGAMVSVVCSNALNRTIKEFNLTTTGKILDKARELVLETFEKSTSEVKDGMDISLLCIDSKNKNIFWSGANNPLWYIQDNELKEIKADKQPIGKTEYPKPFTTHQIEYKENTTFYLFTDGFADQFGGPNGKKFKYKQFSDLLLKHTDLLQVEQSLIIDKAFTEWKGVLEQVDDVCVIGIKI